MFFFLAFLLLFAVLWAAFYPLMPLLRHATRGASRILVRSLRLQSLHARFAAYLPIALIVLAGLAVTAWAADEFLDIAEQLHRKGGAVQTIDTRVHDEVVAHRSHGATEFFITMTTVGGPVGVSVMLAGFAVALLIARRYRWFVYLAVTASGGGLLDFELKHYFARARPDVAEMLRHASGYSFPSGHAMESTVAFGALTYLAFRITHDWKKQSAALAFSITFILSVATSRVYLGVHWLSDVGAGIIGGVCWVTSTTMAYEMLRRVRRLRQMRQEAMSAARDGARSP